MLKKKFVCMNKSSEKIVLTICRNNEETCNDCSLFGNLMCKMEHKDTIIFVWPFITMIGLLTAGIIITRIKVGTPWWAIITFIGVYFLYMFFFFNFWESKILCSHCPFYIIDDSKMLKCYANYGFLKTSKYNPAPITKSEQIQFIIGALLLFFIPMTFLLIIQSFLFAGLVALSTVIFFVNTRNTSCKKCPNFSCILNRVPEEWKEEYFKKNEVMRKAWEESEQK